MAPKNNDAVAIAPDIHKVLFENETVRLLDVQLATGTKASMHWHPNNMSYVVQGGAMRVGKPDGTTSDVQLANGDTVTGSEGEHSVENIGESDIHTIQMEFKT